MENNVTSVARPTLLYINSQRIVVLKVGIPSKPLDSGSDPGSKAEERNL